MLVNYAMPRVASWLGSGHIPTTLRPDEASGFGHTPGNYATDLPGPYGMSTRNSSSGCLQLTKDEPEEDTRVGREGRVAYQKAGVASQEGIVGVRRTGRRD